MSVILNDRCSGDWMNLGKKRAVLPPLRDVDWRQRGQQLVTFQSLSSGNVYDPYPLVI